MAAVPAEKLEPGMVVTKKGWWDTSRRRVRFRVLEVRLPNTGGGWLGKQYWGLLQPVRVRYERLDTGKRAHFVVSSYDRFDVVAHERASVGRE